MIEDQINRTLMLRYWLFGFIILLQLGACWLSFINYTAIRAIEKTQIEQGDDANQNRSMIEGSIRAQIVFQTTVAAVMDKLSKENANPAEIKKRGVRVPRVPINPPDPRTPAPSLAPAPLTDAELTRSPAMSPKPKVEPKHKKKARPSPTPGFFQRLFNPKSMR